MPASTKLFLFPDVNVWVALTYEGHVHHTAARKWLQSLPLDARLFFCRITQLGFLRLLTTAAVMGEMEVLSQAEAWAAYDQCLEDSRVSFLSESHEHLELDLAFRNASGLRRPAPKDWADSYLAAFASVSNLTLVTFDRTLHSKIQRAILLR
jgi:toxin-antitoxin system PIN domain toxin